ncbi:MAG: Ig-like domain-containing protein [Planctomycetota bacterium]|nr:Ig-like domain-containing protein [Planctomycetota bacterium]
MFTLGSRLALAGIVLFMALGPAACGGAGGGPGPDGAGQGLELLSFSDAALDNVPLNCRLRLDFSEPVDPATINNASIQIRQGPSFGVTAPGELIVDGATVWYEPRLPGLCDLSDAGLTPDTQYRVQIIGSPEEFAVRNTSGQSLTTTLTYEFHTLADDAPDLFMDPVPSSGPVVTGTFPENGSQAVAVEAGNAVVVEFSENLHPCSIDTASVRFLMCETGDPNVKVKAPNDRDSGFATASGDTSDQSPDPYTWGALGTTSLMPNPQVIPATLSLDQSFQGTRMRVTPLFGRFPENALIVVEMTFGLEDLGNQALTPYTISFTTENRPREEGSYLLENEGETEYDPALTTAKVNVEGICPSKVQGFLLFAGDGDNGSGILTPTAPEDDPPACTLMRDVNDGSLDHFAPTGNAVLDTGSVVNTCPNAVDGSTAVVWEFASFYIGPSITVQIVGVNPAIILVRGDVTIEEGGRLVLRGDDGQDGKNYPQGQAAAARGGDGVAGGGAGGDSPAANGTAKLGEHGYVGYGSPDYDVLPQGGHGAGHGNAAVSTSSYTSYPSSASGGGGGHATAGESGEANAASGGVWQAPRDGAGGAVYPLGASVERMLQPSAGSGGGAAGWCTGPNNSSYYRHSGGAGGGGGGFVDITSNGNIRIYGTIDASGGDGGQGSLYYINRPFTGGGGGGSGGGIRLLTPHNIDVSGGTLNCSGGVGGLGATSTYGGAAQSNDGGAGGTGRLVLEDGDSIISGQGSASLSPVEGQQGFYRGVFDASRFAGGGLRPVALSEPILVGAFDPEFKDPEQVYGGQTDFRAGIPVLAAGAPGDTRMLIEARGFELLRNGTPSAAPTVGWHTVGYFTTSGQDTMPDWHTGQVAPALRPLDNVGDGISNLNGSEYIQIRITFFLPTGFGALDAGSYIDDWLIRYESDQ